MKKKQKKEYFTSNEPIKSSLPLRFQSIHSNKSGRVKLPLHNCCKGIVNFFQVGFNVLLITSVFKQLKIRLRKEKIKKNEKLPDVQVPMFHPLFFLIYEEMDLIYPY